MAEYIQMGIQVLVAAYLGGLAILIATVHVMAYWKTRNSPKLVVAEWRQFIDQSTDA